MDEFISLPPEIQFVTWQEESELVMKFRLAVLWMLDVALDETLKSPAEAGQSWSDDESERFDQRQERG